MTPDPDRPPPSVPPVPHPSDATEDQKSLQSTLQTISLLIGVVAGVLTPLVWISTTNPPETMAPALIAFAGWASYFMLRLGHLRYMPHMVVFAVMVAALVGVVAFGSVRTAASFLFVAVVAGAGIFLDRTALFATVFISSTVLGGLTIAERQGWLHTPDFRVGLNVWLTHSATMVVVAIMVFYSRSRTRQTLQRLEEELELRQRTEQERDRNMERFARIFRNSPSPMLAQSARSGAILDVNPAFERCYGYRRDQMLGRVDTVLWAEQGQRSHYLKRLFAARRTEQERVSGLRSDGSRFEALISSEMSDDSEDRLVITTVADMTAQDQAVERLRRSEERFAKAFNFSPLKMTITRVSDGTLVEVNQTRDPEQGYRRDGLPGRPTPDTGGWLSPQERQDFVERILREGHVSGHETRMRHADGRVIDARMWAELIEIDGEDCILSCFVNTTEEKRRESELLMLTRGMAGPSGDALFQALTMHMAQAIGADMVTVGELPPNSCVRTLAVWKDGGAGENFTYSLAGAPCGQALSQTGLFAQEHGLFERFPHDQMLDDEGLHAYVGQSLRDEDGTPVGLLNAFWRKPIRLSDTSRALIAIFASRANAELVRLQRDREIQRLNAGLEQRVRERTAELQKLNAELDSFAYSVSHDLKSPLRAIDGFTRLLGEQLQGRLQPDETQLFDRVLASTHRMSTLIADMLALARVSQGQIEWAHTNLSELAEQVMQAEQAKQPERGLRWHIEPGLACVCDPRLMRIALENLLGNAVKYTRDQPGPVIEVGRLPGEPGTPLAFFVRDNGVGFNMAYADKLFKPFQRLHMPSEFDGTGIGLATVRRIVERHGGSVTGTATTGQGAEFRVSMGPARAPATTTRALP